MEKILLIYAKKDTGKYKKFEIYPINENLTKDKLLESVKNYNSNESNDATIKIYDDELLLEFMQDAQSSSRIDNLISNLKSICRDIEDSASALDSWQDDIQELLTNNEGDKDAD